MAKFNEHLKTGAIFGVITAAGLYILQYFKERKKNLSIKFQWSRFLHLVLAGCALGALTGIAADRFEPALNPNHRGFFHSYMAWIISGVALFEFLSGHREMAWKNLAVIGFAGYSSHLLLDSMTPKALPIDGF